MLLLKAKISSRCHNILFRFTKETSNKGIFQKIISAHKFQQPNSNIRLNVCEIPTYMHIPRVYYLTYGFRCNQLHVEFHNRTPIKVILIISPAVWFQLIWSINIENMVAWSSIRSKLAPFQWIQNVLKPNSQKISLKNGKLLVLKWVMQSIRCFNIHTTSTHSRILLWTNDGVLILSYPSRNTNSANVWSWTKNNDNPTIPFYVQ